MRAYTIVVLVCAALTGCLLMRDERQWLPGAVLVGLCVVAIVGQVWIGERDRLDLQAEAAEEAVGELDPPPVVVPFPVPVARGGIRRRCSHIEPWERLCADCTTLLLVTPCHDCAVRLGQPVTIVGCDNCPAVGR